MHVSQLARTQQGQTGRILVAAFIALALVILWRGQPAFAAELAAPAQQEAPADDGNGKGGDDHGDDIKIYAILDSFPADHLSAPWVAGGVAYTATVDTQFSTFHGDFVAGGCVEVEVSPSDPTVAKEIGTEEAAKCTGQPGGGDDHGDGNGNHDGDDGDDIERYGRIDSLPAGDVLTGTWIISGIPYTVTDKTETENEHGGFVPEACVKVEVSASNPTVAKEIETEDDYKCNGQRGDDDDNHEGEGKLFGEIEKLPDDGLIGVWIVSGKNISVTEQTELDAERVFATGAVVKVEFFTLPDDTLVAKEIEVKFDRHEDDDDDGEDDDHDFRQEGQAYGIVESIDDTTAAPDELWVVSGVEYSITERTNFRHDENPQVGDVIKIKFFVLSDDTKVAKKIHLEDGQGRLDNHNVNKLVGIVDSMPISGFVGPWVISGVDFEADLLTRFKEEAGVFAPKAYVEVLYVIERDANNEILVRRIVKIETHVPPGAGDDDTVGDVDSVDDDSASVAAVSANGLVVNGVAYSITPATEIDDDNGEIVVGATVAVNSYVANGQNIATQVRSLTLDNTLMLPLAER